MENAKLLHLLRENMFIALPVGVFALAGLVFLSHIYRVFVATARPTFRGFPLVGMDENTKTPWQLRVQYMKHGREMIWDNVAELNKPFQLETTNGPTIILPPRYIDEVRNDDRMTFAKALHEDFFTSYPGFEGFRPASRNNVFTTSVRVGLTQSINKVTEVLGVEMERIRHKMWPAASAEWTTTAFTFDAKKIVAGLSARTFVPEPLCYSEEWLDLNVQYTISFFTAAFMMRMVPAQFRPLAHWVLPACRKARKDVAAATRLLEPEVERRRIARAQAAAAGEKAADLPNAFQWMESAAGDQRETYNYVHGQLAYTIGAVHTTTGTLVNAVHDLLTHPEYIDLLREEIASVWSPGEPTAKSVLQKLKLMDSFLKESQRFNPVSWMSFHRKVHENITLSDGTVLPKGAHIGLPLNDLWNDQVWPNAKTFDGHRFFNMRQQPGEEAKHQFVTTSTRMLNFGHGKHACPGRFFAANEIKIALVNLLTYYDMRLVPGSDIEVAVENGATRSPNPKWQIQYRLRQT